MIFGTQVGVAPGSLTMQLGNVPGALTFTQNGPQALCPPDPIWTYFPSPFEPYTYFLPPGQAVPTFAPTPQLPPVSITPPPKDPTDPKPRPTIPTKDEIYPPVVTMPPQSPPSSIPSHGPTNYAHGYLDPYADHGKLSGLGRVFGEVGPFGLTWGGFIGVMAVALGGGIGLGVLSKRRRG